MSQQNQLITRIIEEQALIIGPVAWEEASKVNGLKVDSTAHQVQLEGNSKEVLEKLVAQYEHLFGRASREVCRDAVRPLLAHISDNEIPAILR